MGSRLNPRFNGSAPRSSAYTDSWPTRGVECSLNTGQKGCSMPVRCIGRRTLATSILVIVTWTLARLLSKWDIHWTLWVLVGSAVGAFVGAIANNGRGILVEGVVGLIVSLPLLLL